MRFVHVECLTRWRNLSANPKSFVQCENCLYKYSFRRPLYASVLRSALVLHLVTLVLLLCFLLAISLGAQAVDEGYLDLFIKRRASNFAATLDLELLTQYSTPLVQTALAYAYAPFDWLGVDMIYVLASTTFIGVSGFLTFGMLGPILWPSRGQYDLMLVAMIGIGLVRTFLLLYASVIKTSALVLREAEKMIVDVGDSPPPPPEAAAVPVEAGVADVQAGPAEEQARPAAEAPVELDLEAEAAPAEGAG